MLNRLAAAVVLLNFIAASQLLGQGHNAHNRADAADYLMFYSVARDANFVVDSIEGDLLEANHKVKLEKDLYEMASKLYHKHAISLDEYEDKQLDYSIAVENLKMQNARRNLWKSIVLTNEFQTKLSKGEDIDLRNFYEASMQRWSEECIVINHDVKMRKLTEQNRNLDFIRAESLHKKNSVSKSEMLIAQFEWEAARAKTNATLKMATNCQKSIPTWQEIIDIENSLGHPVNSEP